MICFCVSGNFYVLITANILYAIAGNAQVSLRPENMTTMWVAWMEASSDKRHRLGRTTREVSCPVLDGWKVSYNGKMLTAVYITHFF